MAQAHQEEIARKIDGLQAMRATLATLVSACAGDRRPDCPILQGIAVAD